MLPLRVAVLTSSSAPGIEQLLGSPDRGVLYELACVLSSSESFAQRQAVDAAGVPFIVRPLRRIRSLAARDDYDRETADTLRAYGADYVILDGYKYFITGPLLTAERALLTITSVGLQYSFMNQPVTVEALRGRVWALIGSTPPPQLLLRVGYARASREAAPRRPLESVVR